MASSQPSNNGSDLDFATLLEESFRRQDKIGRGAVLDGTIMAINKQGIIIDVGLKRDGVVPRNEAEGLAQRENFTVGQKVKAVVVNIEDREGNLVVSLSQAIAQKDWTAAQRQMESDEAFTAQVGAANKGGLIIPYGELRAFIPASHVLDLPRGLDDDARVAHLSRRIGKPITLKVIEVNAERRRLVFSEKEANRHAREASKDALIEKLEQGQVVEGMVSCLRDFGAFVDLGGADGLIHVSELSWRRINHPGEVVKEGQRVKAVVLQVDPETRRIGLSLKRLLSNPWDDIDSLYQLGQVVEGRVARVVSFGAFVELDEGIEALLHISEMGGSGSNNPEDFVRVGDIITTRIITLEPDRQRIGLSLQIDEASEAEDADVSEDEVALA